MLLHANVGNVQVLDRRAGVPLPPAPVMAGAPPHVAIGLFEAGPDVVRDDAELAEQLAQMQAFANVGNVQVLDRPNREARAFESHVGRVRTANAAPKPAALAPPVRWAASLRTTAARPPRRSAGVPRAVRLGVARSFLCRPRRRRIAIRRSDEPARLPTGEEQERKELEDALRESAAEVCRESERERDERAQRAR
jgi:hypothetical protein